MIYSIFGFDFVFDIKIYQNLLLAASLGLYFRLLLSVVSHQNWLRNYSQYLVFAVLPITGYIITSVIASNIALSLGMVGALSIVRFRTPVKNPSELVIYFCLITLGIVVSVNQNLALNFMVFVTFIVISTEVFQLFTKKLGISPFKESFENIYFMTVSTNSKLQEAETLSELSHVSFNENFMYQFKASDKIRLDEILNLFENSSIISYSIDAPEI